MEEETLTAEEQETLDAHKKMLDEKMRDHKSNINLIPYVYIASRCSKSRELYDTMQELGKEEDENLE